MSVDKFAGYQEPGDAPIDISAIDPLDGDFLFGDDKSDELRTRYDQATTPDKSGQDATNKRLKQSMFFVDAVTRSQIERTAKKQEMELPEGLGRQIRRFIARVQAAMKLGVKPQELAEMFYGGRQLADPLRVAGMGFEAEARFLHAAGEGNADSVPPEDPSAALAQSLEEGDGASVEELLQKWAPMKAELDELRPKFEKLTEDERGLRRQIGPMMDQLEGKVAEVDGILYRYQRNKDKDYTKYADVWEEVMQLVDGPLKEQLEEIKKKHTTKVEMHSIKPSVPRKAGMLSIKKQAEGEEILFDVRRLSSILDKIISALGKVDEGQVAKAAVRSTLPDGLDWMNQIEAEYGAPDPAAALQSPYTTPGQPTSPFIEGDDVQDPQGNRGQVTEVTPDGSFKVVYQQDAPTENAQYDSTAPSKGLVKRTASKPFHSLQPGDVINIGIKDRTAKVESLRGDELVTDEGEVITRSQYARSNPPVKQSQLVDDLFGVFAESVCPVCEGQGHHDQTCGHCGGTGKSEY